MIRLDVPVHMGVNQQQVFLVGSGGFQFRDFGIKPFSVVEAAYDGIEEVMVIGEDRKTKIKYNYYDKLRYVEIGNAGPDGKYTAYKPEVDYMINLYKEFPDEILTYYPEGCFVYPMFVDIETTSINPKSGEVLSIQVAFDDTKRDEEIFLVQGKGLSEKQMILEFIDLCKQSPSGLVPDICVTYNGIRFDIPYLHSRAGTHEVVMKWNTIGRKQDIIYTQGWLVNKRQGEMSEVANGFRVYDMYTLAKMDLKLAKLPSRTQKNVAAFYGCPDVYDLPKEDKYRMREVLEERPDEFKRYSISDIHQLRYLYEVYAMRTAAEANLLKVPFMTAYAMSSGQKSYIALYREARKAGYYGFKMNQDRYEKYFALGKYQGAIVGSWAHGYYDKIIYVDAASMYPSLMESFNLSPDMYKIVEHIPYDQWTDGDPGIIRAEGPPEKKVIYIPDDNFQTIFKFEVNLVDDGYMRKVIEYFKQVRNDYKAKMKSLKKEEGEDAKNLALQYDAMQMAAKVINNTYYGINGNRYYEIGDLPQAVFVTAMGRWCMTELIKFFGGTEEYPTDNGSFGDTVLEVDSVLANTPVYVRSKIDKVVDIIPIEDLHPDVNQKRLLYTGDYEIYTRNGWKNIVYTKAHSVDKDIHRVKVSDGYVDVTSDHSLFLDTLEEISPKDIKVGDKIEVLSFEGQVSGISSGDVIYPSITLDKDLAWFSGLFLAEGSFSIWRGVQGGKRAAGKNWKRTNKLLSISMNSLEILERAKAICDSKFTSFTRSKVNNHTVKIYDTRESSATYRLTGLTTYIAMDFFMSMFYTGDGATKKVPSFILNCNDDDILRAFLSGYMCGDGYIAVNDGRKVFSSDSIDLTLSAGIRYIMHRLGMKTFVVTRDDKLNVTTVKRRFPRPEGTYKLVDKSNVLKNDIISSGRENLVYDISTDDGTFVSAMGDIVLHNTDGLLLDNSRPLPSIDEVNTYIRNRLKDVFSIPEECLTFLMEFEGAGSIYVYKQKNYILRADEDKGKLTVKGSAFTGYDKAPVVKKAVEIMAKSVMFNEIPYDEAVMMCRNLDRPLEDFRYTKTLKKDPDKYSSFESLSNYIMNIEARYGTQKALSEMKSKANKWIEMRTKENKDLKRTAKGLIHDCLNIEELFIILDLVEEMVTGSSKKRSSFYILDIALMYKQRGHSLREDDIIEYYWTATREGYSIADDVKSIAQLDLKRYMKEINKVIERFDYANPSSSELTLY